MYQPRDLPELTAVAREVVSYGIAAVTDIYSVAELALFNSRMDRIFSNTSAHPRSYVRPDDMLESGIFEQIFSRRMRDLIFSVVPDPVLYHLHAYEIAGNSTTSHIFGDQIGGWHRDPDSSFYPSDPTHISIFVYLSDVGMHDGAFQLAPHAPDQPLRSECPALTITGPVGMSFVWHRGFYHRASPNRGPRRRRLIKLSVQPNAFESPHLRETFFARTIRDVPKGDVEMDLLLGRYQGGDAPKLRPPNPVHFFHLEAWHTINLPDHILSEMRRKEQTAVGKPIAYD